MSRSRSSFDWIGLAILLGTFAITLAVYPRLPDPMPSHFGISGTADGWMPRDVAAWLLPLGTLALGLPIRFGSMIMPRRAREFVGPAPVSGIAFLMVTILCATHLLILHAALNPPPRLGEAIWILCGIFLIAAGQWMPRTRRNRVAGFRTAWSLASDENWARAQRVGGYGLSLAGAAMAIFGALGMPVLALCVVPLTAVALIAWSSAMSRRDRSS